MWAPHSVGVWAWEEPQPPNDSDGYARITKLNIKLDVGLWGQTAFFVPLEKLGVWPSASTVYCDLVKFCFSGRGLWQYYYYMNILLLMLKQLDWSTGAVTGCPDTPKLWKCVLHTHFLTVFTDCIHENNVLLLQVILFSVVPVGGWVYVSVRLSTQ